MSNYTDVTDKIVEARQNGNREEVVEELLHLPKGSLSERKAALDFIGIALPLPLPQPEDGTQRSFVYRDGKLLLVEPESAEPQTAATSTENTDSAEATTSAEPTSTEATTDAEQTSTENATSTRKRK